MSALARVVRPCVRRVAALPRVLSRCNSTESQMGPVLAPFAGAITPTGGMHAPHPAPVSHAPAHFPKHEDSYEVDSPENQRSAMEYINDIPPIEVDGITAICDGGDPRLGHPIEFIQLNTVRAGQPQTCKYCGLRYVQSHHH